MSPQPIVMIWLVTFGLILGRCRAMVQASEPMIQPFPLQDVRLDTSSFEARATGLNRKYMMSLDLDSLLLTFRQNAGLPSPGETFSGSWEDPACEVRGQFMGHYLSATARLQGQEQDYWQTDASAGTTLLDQTRSLSFVGDTEVAKRIALIVSELEKVQSKLGDGYLSAFPTTHFDRLESLQPVWAPYYVVLSCSHLFHSAGSCLGLLCLLTVSANCRSIRSWLGYLTSTPFLATRWHCKWWLTWQPTLPSVWTTQSKSTEQSTGTTS